MPFYGDFKAGHEVIAGGLVERLGGEPGAWPLLPVEE
jgi:hypothetical protein